MRSSMSVRYRSAITEKCETGRSTMPMLALREVSFLSGALPKARVTALPWRAVRVSVSTPTLFRFVDTEL